MDINKQNQHLRSLLTIEESRTYKCKAENKFGSGSMTFMVNKLSKTVVTIDSTVEVTKGQPAKLDPIVKHDNYIKDYNVTWYKQKKSGSGRKAHGQKIFKLP